MPCTCPLQAFYTTRDDGKLDISFSNHLARLFKEGKTLPEDRITLPCGNCVGCRLERSRQWAVRCVHEASMHSENSFITLTFNDESIKEQCGDLLTIKIKHMQDFNKRLRKYFNDRRISVYYCGEYGSKNWRPHYHELIFGLQFPDLEPWSKRNGYLYYRSAILEKLWPYGFCTVGEMTFESAAYVSRYCMKKVNGEKQDEHYRGRTPEFAKPSNRPAIGRSWIEKYGLSDVFPYDECVSRGFKCKPPRYYDKYLESIDPEWFKVIKEVRRERALAKMEDNSYDRLKVKQVCIERKLSKLVRSLDFTDG